MAVGARPHGDLAPGAAGAQRPTRYACRLQRFPEGLEPCRAKSALAGIRPARPALGEAGVAICGTLPSARVGARQLLATVRCRGGGGNPERPTETRRGSRVPAAGAPHRPVPGRHAGSARPLAALTPEAGD